MPKHPAPPNPDTWRTALLDYISARPDEPHKPRSLARALGITDGDYTAFRQLTRRLLDEGALVLGRGRNLRIPARTTELIGTFHAHERGFGFVEVPGQPDLYVPPRATGDALDGDVVALRMLPVDRRTGRTRAEIVRIVSRSLRAWVGVLARQGDGWVVYPQQPGAPPVHVAEVGAKGAHAGDLVVVEPLEHTLRDRVVRGVLRERLGPPDEARSTVLAAVRRHGLPGEFPAEVRAAAQKAAARLSEEMPADRTDMRELLTITIDPPDARDFDDAISVEALPGGQSRLGVHIADVAHFVPVGGVLDREALERGNSAYFPRFVVPMLPEVLSNEVCSLQPGVPRYTKSVFITYDAQAHIVATKCANSVIRSAARLTYEQAAAALAGDVGELSADVVALLHRAAGLARAIQKRRLAAGMIVLNLPELELRLDDAGHIVGAGPAETSYPHTLIEMFMVAANEAVCQTLTDANLPHLRRVHPPPEPSAAQNLRALRPLLGRDVPTTLDRDTIRALLRSVHGRPEEEVVNYMLLRSMAQAVYSAGHEGHFALASTHYCHFTSPIRRYPDLVNHRQLDRLLRAKSGGRGRTGTARSGAPRVELDEQECARLASQTSMTERRAQQAERSARGQLLLRFMAGHIGEELAGVVTAVTPYGAFVQVRPYLAEGLVRVSDFGGDQWTFDEQISAHRGQRSGRIVCVGVRTRVIVAAVDVMREELTLVPVVGEPLGLARRPSSAPARTVKPARRSGGRRR